MLDRVRTAGFREYFDPLTGAGHGADEFSWTAALALDLIRAETRCSPAPLSGPGR